MRAPLADQAVLITSTGVRLDPNLVSLVPSITASANPASSGASGLRDPSQATKYTAVSTLPSRPCSTVPSSATFAPTVPTALTFLPGRAPTTQPRYTEDGRSVARQLLDMLAEVHQFYTCKRGPEECLRCDHSVAVPEDLAKQVLANSFRLTAPMIVIGGRYLMLGGVYNAFRQHLEAVRNGA